MLAHATIAISTHLLIIIVMNLSKNLHGVNF